MVFGRCLNLRRALLGLTHAHRTSHTILAMINFDLVYLIMSLGVEIDAEHLSKDMHILLCSYNNGHIMKIIRIFNII